MIIYDKASVQFYGYIIYIVYFSNSLHDHLSTYNIDIYMSFNFHNSSKKFRQPKSIITRFKRSKRRRNLIKNDKSFI